MKLRRRTKRRNSRRR